MTKENKSPWRDPPLQKPPLDYVPLDHAMAPPLAHKPTRFRVPAFARGVTAAGWYLAVVAAGFVLAVATGAI